MIPEAARALKTQVEFKRGEFTKDGQRVSMRYRYAGWWFEVVTKGCLYIVPGSAFAWFWHTGDWPTLAVRHRDGNKLNFDAENLRLTATATCPEIRLLGRVSGGSKVHDGVLRRTIKPDD